MIGREADLALVDEALDETVAGRRPRIVLVSGEAGIGKSRLVAAAVESAGARGMSSTTGRCVAFGDEFQPAAAVRDVVIELLDLAPERARADLLGAPGSALRRLLPDGGRAGDRTVAVDALIDDVASAIHTIAAERPLLVVVEDFHWADDTTRRLVLRLATARWLGAVTLLVTYRSDELHRRHPVLPVVEAVIRGTRPQRVELRRLDRVDVGELCAAITGEVQDDQLVASIHRRSDGNPFFVEELIGSVGGASLSDTLRGLFMARVARLDEPALRVLHVVSLAGSIATDAAAQVTSLDGEHLDTVLAELEACGLLVHRDGRIGFRHELAREVFGDLAPGTESSVHAALARVLSEAAHVHPGEIARHWIGAHDQPRALVALIAAGHAALRVGAAGESLQFFGDALAHWDQVPDASQLTGMDRVDLLLTSCGAALHANRLDAGIDYAELALRHLDPDDVDREIECLLRLRTLYRYSNRWGDCSRVVARLLDRVPVSPASRARSFALTFEACEHHYRGEDGSAFCVEAIATAEACGDRAALVEARSAAAIWLPRERRIDFLRETVAMCHDAVAPEHTLRAVNSLAIELAMEGHLAEWQELVERALSVARSTGLAGPHGPTMAYMVVMALFWRGRWDDAQIAATRNADLMLTEGRLCLDLIAHRRGALRSPAEATRRLGDDLRDGVWDEDPGDYGAACIELSADTDGVDLVCLTEECLGLLHPGTERDRVNIVRAAIHALAERVDHEPASTRDATRRCWAETATRWLDDLDTDEPLWRLDELDLEIARAATARLRGADDPVAWERIAASYATIGMPWEEAIYRHTAARAHLSGTHGRTIAAHERAADDARRARELASALGARPLLDRIEALQRTAKLTAAATVVESAPASTDSYGLTMREREILTLVADGRTNGEIGEELFISTKTASVHVSNILRKLGVANRVEAATAAQRHGLLLHG